MTLLELNEIEDKLVGAIGDGGLSVEEAKRLTIGVELVSPHHRLVPDISRLHNPFDVMSILRIFDFLKIIFDTCR